MGRRVRISRRTGQDRDSARQQRRWQRRDPTGISKSTTNLVLVCPRTIANEKGGLLPKADQDLIGGGDNRGVDLTFSVVACGVDLTPPGIDPRGYLSPFGFGMAHAGKGIEGRHTVQRLPCRKRQPLHHRNPDAQARE